MNRISLSLLPRYAALLERYALTEDELLREQAMIEATELSKTVMAAGPALDQLQELHTRAQALLADQWQTAATGTPQQLARERFVRGDSLALMQALMLPHELSQRAHHEQRWRREHETLVAMFEQTDDMILVLDADGQCDDVNPAFSRLTGWTRREAVEGAGAWATPPTLGQSQRRRNEQACRDGSHLSVEWTISPIFGSKGELTSFVCIGRDLGRQQKIDDSLRENDKLRAIATLAGGIAHDFNNLLGSILGLTELCQLEATEGSRQARNLDRIREAGDKAAALVRQMLDFSRQTEPTLQPVSMAQWLTKVEPLLRAALPHNHSLAVRHDVDEVVLMDMVQMEQVLLNLVRNASQAMGQGHGDVQITLDLAEPLQAPEGSPVNGYVRLKVIDNGEGIAVELRHKIFEPFFTTKSVGEGTGLGLAAVHGIIASHHGVIEVDSEVLVGTTFSIFLPKWAP
jgi:PAS domain S-box-containing protein